MAPSRRASSAGVVATRAAAAPSSSAAAAAAQPLLALAARAQAAAGLGHLTAEEALVFAWFALDAWTHFVIEGLYLFFAVTERASAANSGGAEHSKNPLAFIWREYGRADRRWMTYADPDVMAVELPTVLLMGPGALLCAWATLHRKEWKHVAIILVSWCEIIGGWYTFASTWIKHYFHGLAWDKSDFKGSTSSENAYILCVARRARASRHRRRPL